METHSHAGMLTLAAGALHNMTTTTVGRPLKLKKTVDTAGQRIHLA